MQRDVIDVCSLRQLNFSLTRQNWFRKFASCNEILIDPQSLVRPNDFNKETIERNLKLTCQDVVTIFNIGDKTLRLHLHDAERRWKLSRGTTC